MNSDKTPKCFKRFSGVFVGQVLNMEAFQQLVDLKDGCKKALLSASLSISKVPLVSAKTGSDLLAFSIKQSCHRKNPPASRSTPTQNP